MWPSPLLLPLSHIVPLCSVEHCNRLSNQSPCNPSSSNHSNSVLSFVAAVQSAMLNSLWPHVLQCIKLLLTISLSLLKLMSVESMMTSNHLILCHPLLLLPSIFPQHQGLFQWLSSLHQVVKLLELQLQHWSFQWIFRVDFTLGLTGLICYPKLILSFSFQSKAPL